MIASANHIFLPKCIVSHGDEKTTYHIPDIHLLHKHLYLITGDSGAGKTTFLQHIHRTLPEGIPSIILDQSYEKLLYFYKPIWWNIRLPHIIKGEKSSASMKWAYEQMQNFLMADRFEKEVSVLSGGEKHMVLLMRFADTDHKVLLLDEPSTGLDPRRREQLWRQMKLLVSQERTVIVVAHDVPGSVVTEEVCGFDGCRKEHIQISRVVQE